MINIMKLAVVVNQGCSRGCLGFHSNVFILHSSNLVVCSGYARFSKQGVQEENG